jgi:hypothetical protein
VARLQKPNKSDLNNISQTNDMCAVGEISTSNDHIYPSKEGCQNLMPLSSEKYMCQGRILIGLKPAAALIFECRHKNISLLTAHSQLSWWKALSAIFEAYLPTIHRHTLVISSSRTSHWLKTYNSPFLDRYKEPVCTSRELTNLPMFSVRLTYRAKAPPRLWTCIQKILSFYD